MARPDDPPAPGRREEIEPFWLDYQRTCGVQVEGFAAASFGMSTARWLDHLAWQGARERFGDPVPRDMGARMDTELALIHELDYDGYFLTMYEIVRFCREQGILCQGRGSAANS